MAVKLTGGADVPGEATDKIMSLASGLAGVGKSGFLLSFPDPLWYFNLDRAIGHFKEAWRTREMTYESVSVDVDRPTMATAQQYLVKFDALLRQAIASGTNGSFLMDGWDIFWDIVKIALVKNLDDDTVAKEYGPANEYMNNHLRRLGLSQLNVGFSTMASKVWKGMKNETDTMRADGFKHKDRWLTHEIYMYTPDNMYEPAMIPTVGGKTGQAHMAYISRSKLKESLIGSVVPSLTFGMLYRLTFGANYPEPERLWSPAKAAAVAVAGEK